MLHEMNGPIKAGVRAPTSSLIILLLLANSSSMTQSVFPYSDFFNSFTMLIQFVICCWLSLIMIYKARKIIGPIWGYSYIYLQALNGVIHGADAAATLTVIGSYFLSFSLINYFLLLDGRQIGDILKRIIVGFLFLLLLADLSNWIIRGRGLPQLCESQIPVIIFSVIFLYSLGAKRHFGQLNNKYVFWVFWVVLLYMAISIYADYSKGEEHEKIQKIQFGLVIMVLFLRVIFSWVEKFPLIIFKRRVYWYKVFVGLGVFILIFYIDDIYFALVAEQKRSALLRVATTLSMIDSMSVLSWFIGTGYGSSWKLFEIISYSPADYSLGFDVMYPHSGIVILIYENGIVGIFLVILFLYLRFRRARRNMGVKANKEDFGRNFALLLTIFWVVQNLLYVQGVPVPDIYFQGHIPIYALLIVLIFRSIYTMQKAQFAVLPVK